MRIRVCFPRSWRRRKFTMMIPLFLFILYLSFDADRIRTYRGYWPWHSFKRHSNVNSEYSKGKYYALNSKSYGFNRDSQACIHPILDPFQGEMMKFFKTRQPLRCSVEQNFAFIHNATFRISRIASEKHGKIQCRYVPIYRRDENDDARFGGKLVPISDGDVIPHDFIVVWCRGGDQKIQQLIMSGIRPSAETLNRYAKGKAMKHSLNYDVLMLGFDSVSRMTWLRNLPKSTNYFVNELGGTILEGYNIVGDGTPQALLPILTGKQETELPEARRGHPNADFVDNHPWIWNRFKNAGYVTQWTEDGALIGTFQYRMKGFRNQPTDHYARPFQLVAEREIYRRNPPYCYGSLPRHQNMMNWFKESYLVYGKRPKFMFGFHSEYSHGHTDFLQLADTDFTEFLKFLSNHGYLSHTILILMSDHGARFQNIRRTMQGKLEERMPFFAFRFPESFQRSYPNAMKNFKSNAFRLTTPYDIHATFLHILNFTQPKRGSIKDRGISLFQEIPKERTCANAGIEPHWCACLQWVSVDKESSDVLFAAKSLVKLMNSITENFRNLCSKLRLKTITHAVSFKPNDNLLKFRQSNDTDGRIAQFAENTNSSIVLYQITIVTTPGLGEFEATVQHKTIESAFLPDENAISRINKYGNDPHCVMDEFPHLRPYCYCLTEGRSLWKVNT